MNTVPYVRVIEWNEQVIRGNGKGETGERVRVLQIKKSELNMALLCSQFVVEFPLQLFVVAHGTMKTIYHRKYKHMNQ